METTKKEESLKSLFDRVSCLYCFTRDYVDFKTVGMRTVVLSRLGSIQSDLFELL